jgi:chromosome partitioning protein
MIFKGIMKTFSIVNTKGGVGKSSLTVVVAIVMAIKGLRLLIVDLDDQRSTTYTFIKDKDLLVESDSSYQLMTTDAIITPHIVNDYIHLIPGSDNLVEIDSIDFSIFHTLRERINSLYTGQYDIVFIDAPGHYNQRLITTLTASDYVATPIELEFFSMQAMERMTELIRKVRTSLNGDLHYLGVIPNRVHGFKDNQPVRLIERKTLTEINNSLPENYLFPAICERESIRRIQDDACIDIFNELRKDQDTYQQIEALTNTLIKRIFQ